MYTNSVDNSRPDLDRLNGLHAPDSYALNCHLGDLAFIHKKIKKIGKKAIPAVKGFAQGYAQGGWGGAAAGALTSVTKLKGSSGPKAPKFGQAIPQQYLQEQGVIGQQSFMQANPWVLWAGGGVVLLGAAYLIMRK